MKKLVLVLALAFGIGVFSSNAAFDNKDNKKQEVKKEATVKTEGCCADKAKATGCCADKAKTNDKQATTGCTESQKKSCGASGKSCCEGKKTE